MVYKWKVYQYPVDAQIVGETLEEIEKEHGAVTAKLLLDKARPKDSKIHGLFTWDNKVAAEKWRLHQASMVITGIAVTYSHEDDTEKKVVRAFSNVGSRKHGEFITTATALSDEASRAIVLKHALEELQAFQSKYATLTELAEVFSAIEALQKAG